MRIFRSSTSTNILSSIEEDEGVLSKFSESEVT